MRAIIVALCLFLYPLKAHAADGWLIIKIMLCESELKHNVSGDGGKAYGIAQFHEATFYEFAALAKKELRAAGIYKPRWHNPQHQLFLLNWGLDNGYARRWTCYRTLMEG